MARVLLVEDSPLQAARIRSLLEDAGFDVELAGDGCAALDSLQQGLPDLVVTDLQMPRMDGQALIEAVHEKYPTVPVVLLTAYGREQVAAQALRRGAAGYVPKGDIDRDLAKVVHQVLAKTATARGQG